MTIDEKRNLFLQYAWGFVGTWYSWGGDDPSNIERLTVEYATKKKADVILRGLRSLTDVQYEFQLAMTNRAVTGIETVFVMTSEQYGFTSSTLIRQVASLGGNLTKLIPKNVHNRLQQRLKKREL